MKRLDKKHLISVLKDWAKNFTVIAPQKKDHDECMFDTFDEATFTLDYSKSSVPPKQALFPQNEVIFRIEDGKYKQVTQQSRQLLFGIRACDMKALLQSKSFMSKDFNDEYYEARAKATATVVMACNGPQSSTCFCTTTKSGPFSDAGYDLQFTDLGESYLVEIGSAKGEDLASSELFFSIDDSETARLLAPLRKEAEAQIPVVPEIAELMEKLKLSGVPDDAWEYFGNKCITCGGCSFVCPTCTCFNVFDRVFSEGNGERLRSWDSCLYAGFTKEASGHNPRASQGLRLKRRHEHKLLYHNDRETYGSTSTCVGCGRCSDYCPVHIGSIEVAKHLTEKKS
jgi:sulfhydrogenase subunit beta (sulfur reductase)